MADEETTNPVQEYSRTQDQKSLDSVSMVDELEKQREARGASDLFPTEKGVVLKLLKFPARLVVLATDKIDKPVPPVVMIENKGWSEENTNDPTYQAKLNAYNQKLVATLTRVNLGFGTQVLEYGGVEPPEDSTWADDLADLLELSVGAVGSKSRYVAWLQYFVLTDQEINDLNTAIMKYSAGINVEDVLRAEATFPGVSEGTVDTGLSAERPEGETGDTSNGATDPGAGVRSEGGSEVRPHDVGIVPSPVVRGQGSDGGAPLDAPPN